MVRFLVVALLSLTALPALPCTLVGPAPVDALMPRLDGATDVPTNARLVLLATPTAW